MRRSVALCWLVLVLMQAALIACAQTSGTVKGVVISVDGTLDEVDSFTLLVEGDQLTFVPIPDGDYQFPLPHLREHERSGSPVLVGWELVGTVRYALTLADG
ncbi:MAG: hypothetical protein WBZ40_04375 [Acidimicrobiia bacterium]